MRRLPGAFATSREERGRPAVAARRGRRKTWRRHPAKRSWACTLWTAGSVAARQVVRPFSSSTPINGQPAIKAPLPTSFDCASNSFSSYIAPIAIRSDTFSLSNAQECVRKCVGAVQSGCPRRKECPADSSEAGRAGPADTTQPVRPAVRPLPKSVCLPRLTTARAPDRRALTGDPRPGWAQSSAWHSLTRSIRQTEKLTGHARSMSVAATSIDHACAHVFSAQQFG